MKSIALMIALWAFIVAGCGPTARSQQIQAIRQSASELLVLWKDWGNVRVIGLKAAENKFRATYLANKEALNQKHQEACETIIKWLDEWDMHFERNYRIGQTRPSDEERTKKMSDANFEVGFDLPRLLSDLN